MEIIIIAVILLILVGCGLEMEDSNWYHIKKGEHYSKSLSRIKTPKFTGKSSYIVKFDKSCLYDVTAVGDHINKLVGFTDANSGVHQNSVRFGWRPDMASDSIRIFAYWYVGQQRGYEYIGKVKVNDPFTLDLEITKHNYKFTFASVNYITVMRQKTNKIGLYTRLYPYFGGEPTAPHDMKVYIKEI